MKGLKQYQQSGLILEEPQDGIMLIVTGDFNDGDLLTNVWNFNLRQKGLVCWLLTHYSDSNLCYWMEMYSGMEAKLFSQYVPQAHDTCEFIFAHTIIDAHAYIIRKGKIKEIFPGTYPIPKTKSLYCRYKNDINYPDFGFDDDDDW